MVQWLGLCVSTAGGTGSIPGWGTKISHAARSGQKIGGEKFFAVFCAYTPTLENIKPGHRVIAEAFGLSVSCTGG